MTANIHRESWLAWILSALGSLAIFAGFWFYFVFHRLLGISLRQLASPFLVLAVLILCFSIAAKRSREQLINCGRLAPMAIVVCSLFSFASLWFGYYARKFGLFNSTAALVWYLVSIVLLPLLAFVTFPFVCRMHVSSSVEAPDSSVRARR